MQTRDIPTDTREYRATRPIYVGEGGIDVAQVPSHMPQVAFSIELPNKARHGEFGYAEHAVRCIETLKAYVAEKHINSVESVLH